MSNGELFLRVCRLVVECSLFVFFAQEIHYIMICEKTESDRKSLWRKIRARHAQEKWCWGRFPLSSQVLQKDFLQKKTPHESGFDSSTSSNDSEEPSHKIPRISVAVYKENLILLQHAKVPRILHAMNGIC